MYAGDPYILTGPVGVYDIPNESVGKIIFDCLRKEDPGKVINVDANTGDVLTYGKLLENSIKLTKIFKKLLLTEENIITLITENSIHYISPILAAFYLGIAVNPLNPDYKQGEIKHALSISKPKLIICMDKLIETVFEATKELKLTTTILLMGSQTTDAYNIKRIEDLLKVTPDNENFTAEEFDAASQCALVAMTSGTTGLPKGAFISHQNLIPALKCFTHPNYGNIQPNDVTVTVLPLFHMFGLVTHMSAIMNSMKSIVMNKFKPELFLQCIQEHKVTKLFAVPPLVQFLVTSSMVNGYDISTLKDIIVGGAPTYKNVLTEGKKRLSKVKIRQSYGLTEASGSITIQLPSNNKTNSIGVLLPGVIAKVWNPETNEAVGPLNVGEICFKGLMLTKGYIGDETVNKDCIDEYGFYHTGDLGFYDKENNFHIVDRIKEVIKYKGWQVPPAELEALILTHPSVKDCGVIGISDEKAGQLPLAFIVVRDGVDVSKQEIINYVAERISIQKQLHGGVIFTNEIPKSSSGKILRRQLIEIYKTLH